MSGLETQARVDGFPTRRIGRYRVRAGRPFPYGAVTVPGGINFSVYSDRATSMRLVLFEDGSNEPTGELRFPEEFRVGSVYAMTVFGLDLETLRYGFRADGPFDPVAGDRFDASKILLDPHARQTSGRDVWGREPDWNDAYPYRAQVVSDDFDWEDDTPLHLPSEDLVIYETHVRGFTRHPSSKVSSPGTYAGFSEKIPYLRQLGINCVELLPVFEFDEFDNPRTNPATGERLYNYWGYNTVSFFAPKAGYAATGPLGMQADEFKTMVKNLHRAGIEVLLDVVFNHTAEGNEHGPTLSFRGLDNATYYMLTPHGEYYNFSGTGNTVNCNHPVVRDFVLNCLRYWVSEFHIDGFRFDLAAILDRDFDGTPLPNPPLLQQLAFDPVLRHTKLIAEAWDAGGLYQVGNFPNYGRWSEWNGKFRDVVRRFTKGDPGLVGELATRMAGSPDLYAGRSSTASINFITAHDGFTLNDLVSYNDKHNEDNGEDNRDGANDNHSWNCGQEGPTDSPHIQALRLRQMKNMLLILLASQGVPMLLAGDEVGRTQLGNNNTYCQDNGLSWFDWELLETNAELFEFTRTLIAFRRAHPVLRAAAHPRGHYRVSGFPEISWHGIRAWEPDWAHHVRVLAMLRGGRGAESGEVPDDHVYVAVNAHWEPHDLELPALPADEFWHLFADTGAPAPHGLHQPGAEPALEHPGRYRLGAHSAVILVGRRAAQPANNPAKQ